MHATVRFYNSFTSTHNSPRIYVYFSYLCIEWKDPQELSSLPQLILKGTSCCTINRNLEVWKKSVLSFYNQQNFRLQHLKMSVIDRKTHTYIFFLLLYHLDIPKNNVYNKSHVINIILCIYSPRRTLQCDQG